VGVERSDLMDGAFISAVVGLSSFPIIAVVGIVLLCRRYWGRAFGCLLPGVGVPILCLLAVAGVITQLWSFFLGIFILMGVSALLVTLLENRFPRV